MSGTTIRRTLPCSRCAYDLAGLPAEGACPECGQPIVATMAARLEALDPDARPVRPAGAARLATTLALCAAAALCGSIALPALCLEWLLEAGAAPLQLQRTLGDIVLAIRALGVAGTLVGAIVLLVPANRGSGPLTLRSRLAGAAGFTGWALMGITDPTARTVTLMAVPAILALLSIGPLLKAIGPISATYRSAGRSRQRPEELALAAGFAAVIHLSAEIAREASVPREVQLGLDIVALASAGLFLVGLGYLLRNAIWILRAARRPSLTLDELLDDGTDGDT